MKNFLTEPFKWAYQKSNGVSAKKVILSQVFCQTVGCPGFTHRLRCCDLTLRTPLQSFVASPGDGCLGRSDPAIIICNIFPLAGGYKKTLLRVLYAKKLTK
jgi:hypothetical protein